MGERRHCFRDAAFRFRLQATNLGRSATMPRTAVYAKTSYYASWPQSIIVAFIADDPELRSRRRSLPFVHFGHSAMEG